MGDRRERIGRVARLARWCLVAMWVCRAHLTFGSCSLAVHPAAPIEILPCQAEHKVVSRARDARIQTDSRPTGLKRADAGRTDRPRVRQLSGHSCRRRWWWRSHSAAAGQALRHRRRLIAASVDRHTRACVRSRSGLRRNLPWRCPRRWWCATTRSRRQGQRQHECRCRTREIGAGFYHLGALVTSYPGLVRPRASPGDRGSLRPARPPDANGGVCGR